MHLLSSGANNRKTFCFTCAPSLSSANYFVPNNIYLHLINNLYIH